jgi:hypothetical protein
MILEQYRGLFRTLIIDDLDHASPQVEARVEALL